MSNSEIVSKLFVSITKLEELSRIPEGVDGVEFRLSSPREGPEVLKRCRHPVLLTYRGNLEPIIDLRPPFIDIEWNAPPALIERAMKHSQVILSYHGPFDPKVYEVMRRCPAYTYKIACPFDSTIDALKLLLFAKEHPNVSAICMGDRVQFARVLGPLVGNKINFAYLESPTAPGQLSYEEFTSTYHFRKLNRETEIYGLIQSRGQVAESA